MTAAKNNYLTYKINSNSKEENKFMYNFVLMYIYQQYSSNEEINLKKKGFSLRNGNAQNDKTINEN